MLTVRKPLLLTFAGLLMAGLATPAFAASASDGNHHALRDQVNDRIANQKHRITQERHEDGGLSRSQGHANREQLRGVRAQERADARLHGGHITRVEHAQLNGSLNETSREIGR